MSKKAKLKLEGLRRFLLYVLAHEPAEFGLVPCENGFVSLKELLQAIHEESEWRYVRESHIREVLLGKESSHLFEIVDNRIRSLERYWYFEFHRSSPLPSKIMYSPIRKKAHAHVLEKGLRAPEDRHVILSPDKDMAERIGKRKDHQPVLIQVKVEAAREKGVLIHRLGQLFLAKEIPREYIAGPPLKKAELQKSLETKEKHIKEKPLFEVGTFLLDQTKDPDLRRRMKGRKPKGWKEEARKMRRKKKGK